MTAADPNELLAAAVDRAPAAIVVTDGDGRVVAANGTACEILGYGRDHRRGRRLPVRPGPRRAVPRADVTDETYPVVVVEDDAMALRGVTAPAVLMTANRETGFNEAAREAVAQGSVLKTGSADELLDALRRVVGGEAAFDARHPRRDSRRAALSPREREAIQLVAAGATNPEVAEQVGIGRETVKTLLSRAFAKLGTSRRAEAVSEAHRQGLL